MQLTIRTKKEFQDLADTMAKALDLVSCNDTIYQPVDYRTLSDQMPKPAADPKDRVWIPHSDRSLSILANDIQHVLFAGAREKRDFIVMLEQIVPRYDIRDDRILILTDTGVKELRGDGQLHDRSDDFVPNFIGVPLNEDPEAKAEVWDNFVEWLSGEEDATSLLHHLATALAPHWPAIRYVLLIGDGRNGKSVIMQMLVNLLGERNVSSVTRLEMSERSPVCRALNGKLLNVVFDGDSAYIKQTGFEKSMTAGDTVYVRKLYDSDGTPVQTNALFIEGLNREPKTNDKSTALQKRLMRYFLPNVYSEDLAFKRRMETDPAILGAFLSLLIDHYVTPETMVEKLAATRTALVLKLEHARVNNQAVQFLEDVDANDPLRAEGLIGETMPDVVDKFNSWRLKNNDISSWSQAEVEALLRPLFTSARKSVRVKSGKIAKVRVTTGFQKEVTEFLEYIREEEEDIHEDTMVAERAVLEVESAPASTD
jgi:phage/plasmid-associated DNA primase